MLTLEDLKAVYTEMEKMPMSQVFVVSALLQKEINDLKYTNFWYATKLEWRFWWWTVKQMLKVLWGLQK